MEQKFFTLKRLAHLPSDYSLTASTFEHTEPVTQTRLYGAHRASGEVLEVQAYYHWDTKVRREKKPVKVREPGGRVVDA
jgi:hypothetical protein